MTEMGHVARKTPKSGSFNTMAPEGILKKRRRPTKKMARRYYTKCGSMAPADGEQTAVAKCGAKDLSMKERYY